MNWGRSPARSRWSREPRSRSRHSRCAKARLSDAWSRCAATVCTSFTIGLHDQLIFPEISYEKVDKQKGMNVTIVTTAANDNQARTLLKHLGMPFRTQ